jgi:hypothetical protein
MASDEEGVYKRRVYSGGRQRGRATTVRERTKAMDGGDKVCGKGRVLT